MSATKSFDELGLEPSLLPVLKALGYESPTPIQAASIPVLLEGRDLLAQAQTGTGKTAAFALPALSSINLAIKQPQILVITPTRELAIQVAEAFQSYASQMGDVNVASIYGGQDYQIQLRALKRGAHVIVGTPGRIMDHLRRGTLSVEALMTLVLDEADEMLRMGFIDDVEWILDQIPGEHQTALFSATLPSSIKKIADRYLKDAENIHIKASGSTVDAIDQGFIRVSANQKMDVLTRYLEVEDQQAVIVFSRTKTGSAEVAEKLQARGYASAALNGDMKQSHRKKVIDRVKAGSLDIIVATDVAARGIDIDRITHVINYDIPCDAESYIHRIGRTGRAGRTGKALLLVTPREGHLLKDIERAIKKPIQQLEPPSIKEMGERRVQQLAENIVGVITKSKKLKPYQAMVADVLHQLDCDPADVAAALAYLLQQANPLPLAEIEAVEDEPEMKNAKKRRRSARFGGNTSNRRSDKPSDGRRRHGSGQRSEGSRKRDRSSSRSEGVSGGAGSSYGRQARGAGRRGSEAQSEDSSDRYQKRGAGQYSKDASRERRHSGSSNRSEDTSGGRKRGVPGKSADGGYGKKRSTKKPGGSLGNKRKTFNKKPNKR